jgi:hypothetical protein
LDKHWTSASFPRQPPYLIGPTPKPAVIDIRAESIGCLGLGVVTIGESDRAGTHFTSIELTISTPQTAIEMR